MAQTHRDPIFISTNYVEPTPSDFREIGATSAALESASFFIGQFCKDYNDDYMLCKKENGDPRKCLKEGRKVTRCAQDLINRLNQHCQAEWKAHYEALDWYNHMFQSARKEEKAFNDCVLNKLGLEKVIPGTPVGTVPIHQKEKPMLR